MEHIPRSEFYQRYPRRDVTKRFDGACNTLVAENDVVIDGLIQNVIVRSGVQVVIAGLVEKSLTVEPGAIVYVDGLIDGMAEINGAVCIDGHIAGHIYGNGVVYDCCDPVIDETIVTEKTSCPIRGKPK
jgi:hypothetical protein